MSRHSVNRLSDNSWIRKPDEEDEAVDRDPNFGKTILGNVQQISTDSTGSSGSDDYKRQVRSPTSVQALTKRFAGNTDDFKSSTRTSSYSKSTYTTVTNNEQVSSSEIITTQSLRSPTLKSPKTETFSERVQSSSKGQQYTTYSPTRTTRLSETSSNNISEDKLYDTLIPSSIKDRSTTISETYTVKSSNGADVFDKSSWDDDSSTKTVTVTRSTNGDSIKSTTSTRTLSTAEDDLYDSLLPRAITSGLSSPVSSSVTRRDITVERSNAVESPQSPSTTVTSSYSSYSEDLPSLSSKQSYSSYSEDVTSLSSKPNPLKDDYTSERKTYSYSRPSSTYEYSSITSPTDYSSLSSSSTYRSRSEDIDPVYSKSSTNTLYSPRPVLEKDLCTTCRKPFTGDAKIILDDMRINCHAYCFKCEVCKKSLGHLKAGDSMWIYNRMVHCETCFENTRDKWRR